MGSRWIEINRGFIEIIVWSCRKKLAWVRVRIRSLWEDCRKSQGRSERLGE